MVKSVHPAKGRGGYQPTKYLSWDNVKDAKYLTMKYRLNVSLDIMPPEGTDIERKRYIAKKVAHIAEAIKRRRGKAPITVIVFEKGGPQNRSLHGHVLMRVERRDYDIIDRKADGVIIKAAFLNTAAAREAKANYITKQRRPLSPDFEARQQHRYERNPAPVPGKRISFCKYAKALLQTRWEAQAAAKTERAARQAAIVSNMIEQASNMRPVGQEEMFPELASPAGRLRDYFGGILSRSAAMELEFLRKRRGLTQRELGAMAGLSQPQIANAIHGRFGLSFDAAARIKAVLFHRDEELRHDNDYCWLGLIPHGEQLRGNQVK